jgi:hypothetical protein
VQPGFGVAKAVAVSDRTVLHLLPQHHSTTHMVTDQLLNCLLGASRSAQWVQVF